MKVIKPLILSTDFRFNLMYLRTQKFVIVIVALSKFTVLSCCDHTFSLDTKTTWPSKHVTSHVTVRARLGATTKTTTDILGFFTNLQMKAIDKILNVQMWN